MQDKATKYTRRDLLRAGAGGACLLGLGGLAAALLRRGGGEDLVWQIDPDKCIQCGRCSTNCVLKPSTVKCVHSFALCGYCERCFGFFDPKTNEFTSAAENQTCPTGAITRKFVETPYYQYAIDESLCIGCGKCVAGCGQFGNGSLHLQVRHDRCLNCNDCRIAANCPAQAFVRVPASRPYLFRSPEAPL